jgi:GNAT superfamily N-acetyltransferase
MPGTTSTTDASGIRIAAVGTPDDLNRFISLPRRLYRTDSRFVMPLHLERRRHLQPRTNLWFAHAEARFWIAWRDGCPVGRISAQRDHLALERHGAGHFGMLEAEDDPAIFAALLGTAEEFLASYGLRQVRGPFNLSINDECGLLVDGFGTPPSFMMGHARPYYGAHLEAAGYAKAKDMLAYRCTLTPDLPPKGQRLLERIGDAGHAGPARPRGRRRNQELRIVLDIFNDAWSGNWGFVPFTEAELAHVVRNLSPLIQDDLVAIAEVDGEPVAMMVALPNLNEIIADLDGRLLPFGWLKLLWRLRMGRFGSVRVPLMGVRRRHQGTKLGATLMVLMFEALNRAGWRRGIREAELSWVLEDNRPMRHVAESFGAQPYKTYRIYEKPLPKA